ncbi:MAG: glycogen synthase GlgA [Burkholderiales bacterium]
MTESQRTQARMSTDPIRALFVTPECAPLVKTGGLADVSAALPAALTRIAVDVRVLMPAYAPVLAQFPAREEIARIPGTAHFPAARLLQAGLDGGVPLLLLDCPELFDRPGGPYMDAAGAEWPDNALRFGQLSRVAALLAGSRAPLDWRPEVLHCNDWQAGLAPAYLHFAAEPHAASLITIHNLAFQGVFDAGYVGELGLPADSFHMHGLEYYGRLSFLKAGLRYAGHITTVSPTYAAEIQREPLGMGMHGLLAERRDALSGILNGIDTALWDPARDPLIAQPYDAASLAAKAASKRALQQRLGLRVDADVPLLAVVSRLAHQKGIDLVLEAADALCALPAQLAVLGTGEQALEQALAARAACTPGSVAAVLAFDEALSHLFEAGADIFLMPSRFEPCGMNQMYSQRYGTVPVVHATGGLVDSVTDCTPRTLAAGTATGFCFAPAQAHAMLGAVTRAAHAYREPQTWQALQRAGMARDFSWDEGARRYRELYARLLTR